MHKHVDINTYAIHIFKAAFLLARHVRLGGKQEELFRDYQIEYYVTRERCCDGAKENLRKRHGLCKVIHTSKQI